MACRNFLMNSIFPFDIYIKQIPKIPRIRQFPINIYFIGPCYMYIRGRIKYNFISIYLIFVQAFFYHRHFSKLMSIFSDVACFCCISCLTDDLPYHLSIKSRFYRSFYYQPSVSYFFSQLIDGRRSKESIVYRICRND